jgi:hypothetical protein
MAVIFMRFPSFAAGDVKVQAISRDPRAPASLPGANAKLRPAGCVGFGNGNLDAAPL